MAATFIPFVGQLVGSAAKGDAAPLLEASELCHRIASLELEAMRVLAKIR